MRKLLFVRRNHTPYGGAERYLQRLREALRRRGISSEVIHRSYPRAVPSWLKPLLFDREVCRRRSAHGTDATLFSLERISCPDIYRAGDGVHRAFLRSKGPTLNPLHLSYLWLEKRTFENARVIIANSRMVRDQILEYYPQVAPEKIHVVYNGIPLPEKFDKAAAKAALASELGFDPGRPLLLFVGSGFRRKGVRELLRLLSELRGDFHACIVGKEKRLRDYKKLAAKLGLESRVDFTGPRKDVERFYAAADLFLFPTRYEPFSNVVLEALSYSNVVFTTRQNGAAEILPDSWVMRTPDDLSVTAVVDEYLRDSGLLAEGSSRARKIAENFPIERNVDETLRVLDKIQGKLPEQPKDAS